MGVRDHQLDAAQAASGEGAQKLGPEHLGLGGANGHAEHFAPAIAVDGDSDDHRNRDDATVLTGLHVGRIQPKIGPVALQWSIEKGRDLVVDFSAQPADLAFRNAGHAHCFDQIIDRARRYSLNVGLLDHRGERLLGHAARFQKGREITALAQLRDAQLDGSGAGLPNPVAIAVAVIDAVRAALPMRGASQVLDFQLHQSLRGKTDHLAQQISVRALLQQGAKAHHLIGHRRVLGSREGLATKPYRRSAMTTASRDTTSFCRQESEAPSIGLCSGYFGK
jgi:hypothetical protein